MGLGLGSMTSLACPVVQSCVQSCLSRGRQMAGVDEASEGRYRGRVEQWQVAGGEGEWREAAAARVTMDATCSPAVQ